MQKLMVFEKERTRAVTLDKVERGSSQEII